MDIFTRAEVVLTRQGAKDLESSGIHKLAESLWTLRALWGSRSRTFRLPWLKGYLRAKYLSPKMVQPVEL